jgi:uncharacterized protein YbcV (DUF1398 family)
MDTKTITECMRLSFADTPFPQVVGKLAAAGVRSYRADLIRLAKAYYGRDSETHDCTMPLQDVPTVPVRFQEAEVSGAVHAIQRGEIGYAEFLRRIMRAGCASYSVFIDGRKAMYFGHDGQFYTEPFPH